MGWHAVVFTAFAVLQLMSVNSRNTGYDKSLHEHGSKSSIEDLMDQKESFDRSWPTHRENNGFEDRYDHDHYDKDDGEASSHWDHHNHWRQEVEERERYVPEPDHSFKYDDEFTDRLRDLHSDKASSLNEKFFQGDHSDPRKLMRKYSKQNEIPVETPLLRSNGSLSYETLRNCPHGRHLLLITLLEGYEKECWKPRCLGHVKYFLPKSLKSPNQPQSSADASNLKEVTLNGRLMSRDDILHLFKSSPASSVKLNKQFSRFRQADVAAVNALVKLALQFDNFDHLLSFLVVVRDVCNRDVYTEAVLQLVQIRMDVGYIVPNLQSVRPKSFFPIHDAHEYKMDLWDRNQRNTNPVREFSFKTSHRTIPVSDPESSLWHLREDIMVNSMHGIWHLLISDPNAPWVMRRRGELFYYMHKQMLNRYNVERLGIGMPLVSSYKMSDWSRNILKGYNPNLGEKMIAGADYYPPRRDGLRFSDAAIKEMADFSDFVLRSIHRMQINNTRMGYSRGIDHGISVLGDVLEPYPDLAVEGASLLHNYGHVQISELSEKLPGDENAGVMGFAETAMRDPVFYKWHKFTDDFFVVYKGLLGPYSDWDLSYPGVDVMSLSITSGGRYNRLRTYNEFATLELDENMLSTMNGTILRYERLNHDPYVIKIRLHSEVSGGAIGRIFMIPSQTVKDPEMIATVIEMDKFYIDLHYGTNLITRRDIDSSFFTPGPPSLRNLQGRLLRGISETEFNWANCGWPIELAVPRGNAKGQQFELVLMVSKLLPTDRAGIHEWNKLSRTAWNWCGMRQGEGSMPDSRPMGFPFDRPTTLGRIMRGRSNMLAVPVHIHHTG